MNSSIYIVQKFSTEISLWVSSHPKNTGNFAEISQYGCSDQFSFDDEDYPGGMAWEPALVDPSIHTKQDTADKLDFDGMKQFVKLGVAFITEIAR